MKVQRKMENFDKKLTFHEFSMFCEMLSTQEKRSDRGKRRRDSLMSKFFKACREKMPASDSDQSLFPLMRLLLPYLDKRVYR